MNILMVSPSAPPKSGPEAMQVGRYLQELDKHHTITLVTTPVLTKGWITQDKSLKVSLHNTTSVVLKLPFHSFWMRLFGSRYGDFFLKNQIDSDFWILHRVSAVLEGLKHKPDIIYSRSLPMSSALLAKKLKETLSIPWIMHMSDPWADSPYIKKSTVLERYEKICFESADAIALTTESMASFYRDKYPRFAEKIFISANVLPGVEKNAQRVFLKSKKLTVLYTGNFYGPRRPTTVLKALHLVENKYPDFADMIEVKFVGNLTDEIRDEIDTYGLKQVDVVGKCSYSEVMVLQRNADVLLSIEPDGEHPLLKTFMPSKILDYIASGKPILAITPRGSETWKICSKGFGWSVEPDKHVSLGELFIQLVKEYLDDPDAMFSVTSPSVEELTVEYNVKKLNEQMHRLLDSKTKRVM